MRCPAGDRDRRAFLGLLTVGLAATMAGCADSPNHPSVAASASPPPTPTTTPNDPDVPTTPTAVPAGQRTLTHGPAGTKQIALTVDDGYCDKCVGGYVDLAQRTGVHLTFSPNGTYGNIWSKYADRLKPLIERSQVQIINHTFSHKDLRKMTDQQIGTELERNDDWVHSTFGIVTRPYYRPPFGFRNAHVDEVTAKLGYTSTVLWNGSYSDSEVITPQFLMSQARKYLQPGTIMLGHANHPTVLGLFDQIQQVIQERGLTPVTLDEMFGTSRSS